MELVWAVDELTSASRMVKFPFFHTTHRFLGNELLFNDYLIVETNYVDGVPYFTTSAAYKAEMWEPSPRQISKLIEVAYENMYLWTEINTNTPSIQWGSYATPGSIDDNVPWWVYIYAARMKTYYVDIGRGNYYACPPAAFISSNPVVSYGGRMVHVDGRPYPLLEYPIHEYPFGATITQQVFKTFSCEEDDGEPVQFVLLPPVLDRGEEGFYDPLSHWNYRLDLGIHDVENLVISWDSTTHPYSTNELGFTLVYADKTNAIGPMLAFYSNNYQQLLPLRSYPPINYDNILINYATNSTEVFGSLPMNIPCTNIIPINLIFTSGNQYTQRVPGITAMINGIVPSGRHDPIFAVPPNSTDSVRWGFAGWTDSWTVLRRIRHLIAELPKRSHVAARISLVEQSHYSRYSVLNNYDGGTTCDDVELFADFGDNSTNYNYSSYAGMEVYAYDNGWISDVVVYGRPHHMHYDDPWESYVIAKGFLSGKVSSEGLGSKEKSGSGMARLITFAIEVDNYFVESRPLYYPTIGSVDIYITTNYWTATDFLNERPEIRGGLNYYTNYVFDEYPTFARDWSGTYLIMPGSNKPTINANSTEALQDLHYATLVAADNNCTGTNELAKKSGAIEYRIRPVMIANWNFTTNFDAYWDMYPAPE